MSRLGRLSDLVLPVTIIACVLVLIVPLAPALMDLLLAANITVAVIVLLTTIYVRTPLEFSVFPTILLATTLTRLVLNVATTRLILVHADTRGLDAAGGVIRSFGQFVTGDRLVVGAVIFLIIVVIQFVVITKGATRISEVAARFALDGMPGRQMAIDADLSAGVISEQQAQQRRDEIARQADFYGAMDGASKFVRGDAVAGLVITLVNIGGGLIIGVWEAGMSPGAAATLFSKLTIGDGLVSQVPALLISIAAGLLVTRSTQAVDLPGEFVGQLLSRPRALAIAAVFLGILVFTSLPTIPLLLLGAGCVGLAVIAGRQRTVHPTQAERSRPARDGAPEAEPTIEDYLAVDPMEVEIGLGLIRLADPQRGGDLLARIAHVRRAVASDVGIVLPKVRVRDNLQLRENQYRIKIADNPVGQAQVYPGRLLATHPNPGQELLPGIEDYEGAQRGVRVWIDPALKGRAEQLGYVLTAPATILTDHLRETVHRHADELLTRDATRQLIDELRKASPAVVEELIPDVLKLGEVQQVLQLLLRENVPIRQLANILEALGDNARHTRDPEQLVEHVRQRLARTISTRFRDEQHRLHVVTLDPELEEQIAATIPPRPGQRRARLPPALRSRICRALSAETDKLAAGGHRPIVLVGAHVRAAVRQLTVDALPRLTVLSYQEITRDTKVASVGIVSQMAEAA